MKKKSKIITFTFSLFMALSILAFGGYTENVYAVTVGQQLLQPEEGWKRINDSDTNFWYSPSVGVYKNDSRGYLNDFHYISKSATQLGSIKFNFTGTKLRIIAITDPNYDDFPFVYIDGYTYRFSEKAKSSNHAIVYENLELSDTEHCVEIANYAVGQALSFDAIDIDENAEIKPYNNGVVVTSVVLNKTSQDIFVNQSDTLIATITPSSSPNKNVKWTSSAPDIATVDNNGKVTGIKEGKATITVTTESRGRTATCVVNVKEPKLSTTNISLNKTTDSLIVGSNDQLSAMITPENATNKSVTWTSSDSSVATVDNAGKVTALKAGTATVTATTQDGTNLSASCTVTVTEDNAKKIILNVEPEKNKIRVNETVSANLVIDNITNIAAEDIRIKYDATKLQFVDMQDVDGIKLVRSLTNPGELRVIVASKGVNNIVNSKKVLLKINFKGIAKGEALVDITKARVSDGISSEDDLTDENCGQATIIIENGDVNNSGEFTLLDLAIDARHFGEAPSTLPQYNTDIVVNNAIDDADLTEIGNQMLLNTNYQ